MRKYKNENCNVCNKISIKKISRVSYVNKKDRINWIHDSTFELLGLKKTEIYMGLCLNSFHLLQEILAIYLLFAEPPLHRTVTTM